MKKLKKMVITLIVLACAIGLTTAYFMSKNWMYRYQAEMDEFFGEGNWEYLFKEKEKSTAFTKYIDGSNNSTPSEFPGSYNNWHIRFDHKYGEDEEWYLSNHTLKINQDRNGIFSSKRLSTKQAFYMELMDVALFVASNEIFHEFIRSELTETEANTIDISMYPIGKPKPKLYSNLAKEEWFHVNTVTAEDFLSYDQQEFKIIIRARDYRLVRVTEEERQNVSDGLDRVEQRLLEKYGEHASFEIFFDDEMKAEYVNGEKQR